ncbi:MAG: glutamyl-tRNA reductase [Desulfobulbaceae bacterium]|nr:MAG: glutamyl-tRNA reductase [Desulfobulbaceae bacterium]
MPGERIILLGVNHKTTPVEVREKMAISGGYEQPLAELKRIEGVRECYLLSTCNRVELLLVAEPGEQLIDNILAFLFGDRVQREKCLEYLYIYYDRDAVHHLFMVSASLDSMIVGEAQILGQLKEAYRHAAKLNCTGTLLNRLLHKAFSVAKRVRTETAIGSSAVSISYAAVQLAKKIFGNLKDKKVLLIGAGEMAELAAEHLVGQGVAEVVVANRTLARGVELAKRFHGRAVSFDELLGQLEQVDIIISSTGSPTIILRQADVRPVMRARRNRPLFFIDIAVPRDLDPDLNDMENVYLYDIDDLSSVVDMNRSEREREAVKAARIVDEMTLSFQRWMDGMSVTPTILALRRKADGICRSELEKTLPRLAALSGEEKQAIEVMLSAITAKMLHDPLVYLKSESCGGRDTSEAKINALRTIFGLGEDES